MSLLTESENDTFGGSFFTAGMNFTKPSDTDDIPRLLFLSRHICSVNFNGHYFVGLLYSRRALSVDAQLY